MTSIATHVNKLIDAYVELIRSRAFWNTVNAFDFIALTVCIVLVVVVVCTYLIAKKTEGEQHEK